MKPVQYSSKYARTVNAIILFLIISVLTPIGISLYQKLPFEFKETVPPWVTISLSAFTILAVGFFRYLGKNSGESLNSISERLIRLESFVKKKAAEPARLTISEPIDAETRSTLIQDLKAALISSAKEETLTDIRDSIVQANYEIESQQIMEGTTRRLSLQIELLLRRSTMNLFIGVSLGVIGLSILGYTAVIDHQFSDVTAFLLSSVPRFTFAILIELLSYFFLKLYKDSEKEIRYFHNELTNQENCMLAMQVSRLEQNEQLLSQCLNAFLLPRHESNTNKELNTKDTAKIEAPNPLNGIPQIQKTLGEIATTLEKLAPHS